MKLLRKKLFKFMYKKPYKGYTSNDLTIHFDPL